MMGEWPVHRDHPGMIADHLDPYCLAKIYTMKLIYLYLIQINTYIPISIVVSNNSSRVKIKILQVKVSFDIIGKVFVAPFT